MFSKAFENISKTWKEIFHPKESEIEFESFVKFPKFMFRLGFFTFDEVPASETRRQKLVRELKENYFRICVFGFFLMIVMLLMFVITTFDNLAASAIPVSNLLCAALALVRIVVTAMNKEKLSKSFEDLRAVSLLRDGDNSVHKVKDYLDNYHRFGKTFAFACFSSMAPILALQLSYFWSGEMVELVPFWYPFDARRCGIFPVTFVWTDWNAYNGVALLIASDSLLYALITAIAMEFDILRTNIEDFGSIPSDKKLRKLETFINRHTKLYEVCDGLQEVYGIDFLANFVVVSMITCLYTFALIAGNPDLPTTSYLIGTISVYCGRIFVLSFFVQKMIDSCLSVACGVYESGWENETDQTIKKELMLIMQRSQRPATLTAMNFADVSLETFKKILSTTWSYFSLMRSLYNADD